MTLHPLLDIDRVDRNPADYLSSIGEVFAVFGAENQDSENISYGVRIGDGRFFIKTAGELDVVTSVSDHASRCELLRNAVRVFQSCRHPVLTCLLHVIESEHGPLLVYKWADGELLGYDKNAADSALARFRCLDVNTICNALDQIYDAHRVLAKAEWIAVDFYLGSIIYDFAKHQVHLMDLDMYHAGSFTNQMGRMFGSRSLMAPEEFQKGALIDEATNVFVMGRAAFLLLGDGTSERDAFGGTDAVFDVVTRACRADREHRFVSMEAFCNAWKMARTGT
jgi:serine/threonine-protein kinase